MKLCVRCRLADEIADESADHRTHDANGRGGNKSHLIGPWHQRAADPPDDEPHNHRPDDVQHVGSPLAAAKLAATARESVHHALVECTASVTCARTDWPEPDWVDNAGDASALTHVDADDERHARGDRIGLIVL